LARIHQFGNKRLKQLPIAIVKPIVQSSTKSSQRGARARRPISMLSAGHPRHGFHQANTILAGLVSSAPQMECFQV
jgi:hypothetical protein